MASQGYYGRCKESRHTIFKDCPEVRELKTGKPGIRRGDPKKKAKDAMKADSTFQVSSAIPIHTTAGVKTGIPDSGSGVTLMKKTIAEEIPGEQPIQPATKIYYARITTCPIQRGFHSSYLRIG